jgi:hypothetical protein
MSRTWGEASKKLRLEGGELTVVSDPRADGVC